MKIKRFKLTTLFAEGLRQKEMNVIIGGNSCGCSCAYADYGGSSTSANMNANYKVTTTSSYGCNQVMKDEEYGLGVLVQNYA
ncbi:MAG: TIGR04149 family rSAM-modified RiPP [Bacteroides sp.]|nr:TIGR04149 family rSAM-modified RiPP [Bacteroides sp.]MCM1448578.1 TIGR04149 family rSAM-modified RiPP [Bacteroides sp.]MCM1515448.1 TIGR04149 family rSAM-modified RiPP [Paraprevotella sp.]